MVNVGSGMVMDDSGSLSPPPPALPPRRYRGEMDLTVVDRQPTSHSVALPSRCADTTNGESTLPHDTYANQLRRQARRYQQSRGSSFSHHRPGPPDWKPPPPPFLPQELPHQTSYDEMVSTRRSFESEFGVKLHSEDALSPPLVSPQELPRQQSYDATVFTRRSFESELGGKFHAEDVLSCVSETDHPKSAKNSTTESEIKNSSTSLPEVGTPSVDPDTARSEVQRVLGHHIESPRDSSFESVSTSDLHHESPSSVTHGCHPAVDVVSAYDRYYGVLDDTRSLSQSFSSVDSRSSDVSCVRRFSQPAVKLSAQVTRRGSNFAETSSRSAESSTIERSTDSPYSGQHALMVNQKVTSTSDAEIPNGRNHLNTSVEVQPEIVTPCLKDAADTSGKVVDQEQSPPEVTEPSLTEPKFFRRQKFPVELECVRQAETVAGLLRRMDRDEGLVNILVPCPGHRTATDFMAKVLNMVEPELRTYDDLPETLRLRLSARDVRHSSL